MMDPTILHEDGTLLLLDKPAGMVVNRARSVSGITLQDWIEGHLSFPISRSAYHRSGIVHRLDRETSGVMIVAKTREAFASLQEQFARRAVHKLYLALVHGRVLPREGSIVLPVDRSSRDRQRIVVSATGRKAVTGWRVRRYYNRLMKSGVLTRGYQGFSLLEVTPETGRTHQIRVHLAHLQHPVVGDERYCSKKRSREDRKWCPRQFLHAHRIAFSHPTTGKRVEFEAPLPEDLQKVLNLLS